MGVLKRMYRGNNDFDFPKWFPRAGLLSALLCVGSIITIAVQWVPLSIDFEGGSVWEVSSDSFTAEQAEAVITEAGGVEGRTVTVDKVQAAETVDGERTLRISGRVEIDQPEESDAEEVASERRETTVEVGAEIADSLAEAAGVDAEDVSVNTVGKTWGDDITRQALVSLIVFMVLVTLYISWRLEFRMAIAALAAVVHDILITVGVYSLFQITVTPATVISFLTILGFSLYDTIVVYDRVQDNADRLGRTGRYTYTAVMRRSLNQVLMRSINTSITTLLPIISMLVVGNFMLGQSTIGDFSLALLIGLMLGTYSSLFVASPITVLLKEREGRWREIRTRIENRGQDPSDTAWYGLGTEQRAASTAAVTGAPSSPPAESATPATGTGLTPGGHPPRPRKKKRRR